MFLLKFSGMTTSPPNRKPGWLKTEIPSGKSYLRVKEIIERHRLHTICTSGACPNMADCWSRGTATLMILGDTCTRSCRFCNVKTGRPLPPDPDEPDMVADSIRLMGVKHCVITSVDRDDLPDGGSLHWSETIRRIREVNPGVTLEALIPDFSGCEDDLERLVAAAPEIISHNLETVRRLTPLVRSRARYELSLQVLRFLSGRGARTKSGIMAGLGETEDEVYRTMDDLLAAGCRIFTIGQYLQPTRKHLPVAEFVHPDVFLKYREQGLKKGFDHVESGPLVRSSYRAETQL